MAGMRFVKFLWLVITVTVCLKVKPENNFNEQHFQSIGNKFVCLILGLCTSPVFSHFGPTDKLTPVYQWRFLEYQFESPQQKEAYLVNETLIPRKPAPIDVDVYFSRLTGERTVFVTIPRFQNGVPAALGTVVLDNNRNPLVKPYPSWEWFTEPTKCKPNRIVSVYRIIIDECDRLWVLDQGQLDAEVICRPQILAFDLKTNQLVHKYEIPEDQYQPFSTFVTPIVEVLSKENQCKNTFLYLADCQGFSLVVYDVSRKKSWRAQHYSMYPDPDFATFTVVGESFDIMDGILGMSLGPNLPGEGRKLFYHAMSSDTENWVYTRDLQKENLFVNNSEGYSRIFHTYRGRRGTQSVAEAIDREGVMYFGLVSEVNIACFVTQGQYGRNCTSTDIVASNQQTLQFPSGMKVITTPNGRQELWVVTSRFQKVANDNIKNTEVNFRILAGKTDELKMGTRCQRQLIYPSTQSAIIFPEEGRKK